MIVDPTNDKTCAILRKHLEPLCRSIPAIKHVGEQWSPFPDRDAQEFFFRLSQPGGKHTFLRPPLRHRQMREPLHAHNQPGALLHPHHTHRAGSGPIEDQAPLGPVSACRFTGKDRADFSRTLPSHTHQMRWPCSLRCFTSALAFSMRDPSIRFTVHVTERNSFPSRLMPAGALSDSPLRPSREEPSSLNHSVWGLLRRRMIATRHCNKVRTSRVSRAIRKGFTKLSSRRSRCCDPPADHFPDV